jgi:uncharacterized OB-fold protein
MTVDLPACAHCGHATFPRHLRCARCGSVEWTTTSVYGGRIEHVTVVRRSLVASVLGGDAPRLALVVTDAGARVVARLCVPAQNGDQVALEEECGALIAVPTDGAQG